MALLSITDAGGRQWQVALSGQSVCTIGRAPDNSVVLNDPRASRYHAHIKYQSGAFVIVDGRDGGGRSANHVFVNGQQRLEHPLSDGDQILVGASRLRFEQAEEQKRQSDVAYDDRPLGHTQLLVSASDIIKSALQA
ncbi:MAG TPA: FHA domain-containing protein, partial [Pyrinomonadaceae bacterium]|nr:FHA domain-containing protein [Pyrinomonadaceae bacterium]